MSRLLRVEFRRLLSRRLVRIGVLAVFVLLAGISVIQGFRHSTDVAGARARITAQMQDQQKQGGGFGVNCTGDSGPIETDPQTGRPINLPANCHELTVDEMIDQQLAYNDPRFIFVRDAPSLVTGGIVIAALLAFVLSASAVGAEWNSGMFASLLTWEPRRQRVLAAKTAASVLFFTAVGAALIGMQWASAWLLATTRGTFQDLRPLYDGGRTSFPPIGPLLAGSFGRGVAFVAIAAALGAALAGIARSTAGAMAVIGGYLVVVEIGLRSLTQGHTRWLLSTNIAALVNGKVDLPLPPQTSFNQQMPQPDILHASAAAVFVLVVIAAVTAVHAVALQRRDAT